MLQFTIIVNTPNPILHMEFYGAPATRLLVHIFTGSPKASSIPRLLTASEELKSRLHLMDAIGDKSFKL